MHCICQQLRKIDLMDRTIKADFCWVAKKSELGIPNCDDCGNVWKATIFSEQVFAPE